MPGSEFLAPISFGEAVDKITILQIKKVKLSDPGKRENVARELEALERRYQEHVGAPTPQLVKLTDGLRAINTELWDIEDGKRDCERRADFGPKFIELARLVYLRNDERARIKKEINLTLGSAIVEEKSYGDYTGEV